ncbi:MAG: putative damage-inducible protein DinB [Pirellulaceae bacterium]|jgi:uncharacterized damage-inducible protein DinB
MDFKAHAKYSLERARWLTEQLLESFKTENDWFYQSHDKANHALWVIGHLALADNMFASKFRESTGSKPDGYDELFWYGSELQDDRSKYPDKDEVLAYFRDRRENLMKVLDELSEEELSAPGPGPEESSPIAGAPALGQLLIFATYHEGMHTGQLTVAHRGLGQEPLFAPKPAATE